MNNFTKIKELREIISVSLSSLISKRCILVDAPYYHNIGDVLIWEGEMSFLRSMNVDVSYICSYETCVFPIIDESTTILFQGGGNIGDIYPEHVNFLLKIIKAYPNNKIIIFPQTVYYKDRLTQIQDFNFILSHKNIYFCARDSFVYNEIYPFFKEKSLLIPDMAFYIPNNILSPFISKTQKNKLIIQRTDCEKTAIDNIIYDAEDVCDWPTFRYSFMKETVINKIFKKTSDLHLPFIKILIDKLWDYYAFKIFKGKMIKVGVEFISPYKIIETSRLHGCILSILLDKEVILVNNSYGKNLHFYNTWLSDLDSVSLKK